MAKNIIATRLHEARKMRGLSMDALVDLMGGIVSKQSISRYEADAMNPKEDVCHALAKALEVSVDYLWGTNLFLDIPMLRSTSEEKLSEQELDCVEARISYWAERYLAEENEAELHVDFVNPLKGIIVSDIEDTSEPADLLRSYWRCGDGPIPSILRLLERKGIKIFDTKLPENLLGMSTWANKTHPLIVIDTSKGTVDRLRFTVGHELGHLLLDIPEDIDPKKREQICNAFSSFFLLPKSTYIEEMGGKPRTYVTLEELIDLKEVYGISVAALIIEARHSGIIDVEYKRWWYDEYIQKNKKEIGWGHYAFPETLGREKRIESINKAKKEERK